MPDLGRFQDAFSEALAGRTAPLAEWLPAETAPLLSVYRNTILSGTLEALALAYPTVATLVGRDWFMAAGARYVEAHPPTTASLNLYGQTFPGWLAGFAPAAALPYLPGVARADRMWLESYFAADAPALAPEAFARLTAADYLSRVARLHPSVRFAQFADNAPGLWLAHREGATAGDITYQPRPEGLLIVRASLTLDLCAIGPGAVAFLEACAAGMPLGRASEAAIAADPVADLAAFFAEAIGLGVFTDLIPAPAPT